MKRTTAAVGLLLATCAPVSAQNIQNVAFADVCQTPVSSNVCLFRSQPVDRFEGGSAALSSVLKLNAATSYSGVFESMDLEGVIDIVDAGDDDFGSWSLKQLLDLRHFLSGGADAAPLSKPETEAADRVPSPAQIDKALSDLFAKREAYAAARRFEQQRETNREVGVGRAKLDAALKAHLTRRDAWGRTPWDDAQGHTGIHANSAQSVPYASLPTDLDQLLQTRSRWGQKDSVRSIAAPLANGARVPLAVAQKTGAGGQHDARTTADVIVNDYADRTVPQLEAFSAVEADKALKALLTKRTAWAEGRDEISYETLPTTSLADALAKRESWRSGAVQGLASLPTTSVADLLEARAAWSSRLSADGSAGSLATLPVKSLKALLAKRDQWRDAAGRTFASLSTKSVAALLKQRASWGRGDGSKIAIVPLAKGVLPQQTFAALSVAQPDVGGADAPVIVNVADVREPVKIRPYAQSATRRNLRQLLAKRERWTSKYKAYASLPKTSVKALLAKRASWGRGDGARIALAPLARGILAGERFNLPKPQIASVQSVRPIIHAAATSSAPKLTPVSPLANRLALNRLLAQRAAWAKTKASRAIGYANLSTKSIGSLLAQREAWSKVAGRPLKDAAPRATASSTASLATCRERVLSLTGGGVIGFAMARSDIADDLSATLTDVADVVKQCDGAVLRVEGHTDAVGSVEDNLKLSRERARAVAAFLKNAGVPDEQIEAVGFGEARPLAPNTTALNRAGNRRIEFSVRALPFHREAD